MGRHIVRQHEPAKQIPLTPNGPTSTVDIGKFGSGLSEGPHYWKDRLEHVLAVICCAPPTRTASASAEAVRRAQFHNDSS